MSEFDGNHSAGCSGDCCGCGSDCGTDGQATVTLTLDDGTIQECAILTIFPVEDKEYIALLTRYLRVRTERFTCTASRRRMDSQASTIL